MNEKTKFKLVFALLAFVLAHFYPNICDFFAYDNKNTSSSPSRSSSPSSSSLVIVDEQQKQHEHDLAAASHKRHIIRSWRSFVSTPKENLKIAIGLNTNVDLILSAVELFDQLNRERPFPPLKSYNHHVLNDVDEFKSCFKYHFARGSAAERTFHQKSDFERVLNAGVQLQHKQWFIGGNAALMALGLSKRAHNNNNTQIYLFGPVGPRLREMLTLDSTGANTSSTIQIANTSLIESDEVHLILEYGEREDFEDTHAPRPNRFIVSHDHYNSRMELIDEFFEFVKTYEPHLIILSGLHLLESQSDQFRQSKLSEMNRLLGELKKGMVHLELASIGDETLMKQVLESNLLKNIHSLGLNEQELLFMAQASETAPHSTYYNEFDGTFPDLNKTIDIIEWILTEYGRGGGAGAAKLNRVHFHCLNYHIIAETTSSSRSSYNTRSSLLSGAKVASKQACGVEFDDESDDERLENLLDLKWLAEDQERSVWLRVDSNDDDEGNKRVEEFEFDASNPVIEFVRARHGIRFYLTPVLVCRDPVKTVGLGDAISASGLFYSFS